LSSWHAFGSKHVQERLPAPRPARTPQTAGNCSPIVRDTQGNVQVNINCPIQLTAIQLTAIQLKQLIDEVRRPTPIPPEMFDRIEHLSQVLGVTKGAVTTFLQTLGERDVPEQDLDAKLRQIAAQHLTLVKQLQEVSGDDPAVAALKKQAATALDTGDDARGRQLLEQARDADLEAARQAQEAAQRMVAVAEQRLLAGAQSQAQLGELDAKGLRYGDALAAFLKAADLVPGDQPLARANYLNRAARRRSMRASMLPPIRN
jgi:hypothetical protein